VRPADGLETALAWAHALTRRDGPTALVLSRQKIAKIERPTGFDVEKALRGGYVVSDPPGAKVTLVATGSELATAQGAAALLARKGVAARLVSVPCLTCFEAQPEAVRREVVPAGQRVAVVEAGRGIEWWRLAGRDGLVLGIDGFGASGPEKALAEAYGFTPEKVAARVEAWLGA
jgi:transketolase